jgi:hypothetical protein
MGWLLYLAALGQEAAAAGNVDGSIVTAAAFM